MVKAKKLLKNVEFTKSAYDTARGAHALVIVTEWQEFKQIDLKKIRKLMIHPIIIDGRNIFDPQKMAELGFIYKSFGR